MIAPDPEDGAYSTDWAARARIHGHLAWIECRVVKISSVGATIELEWSPGEDVLERVLHVRVFSEHSDDELRVTGTIVQQTVPTGGRTRVQLRFAGPPLGYAELVELLLRLRRG